jgi:hypothetical protein
MTAYYECSFFWVLGMERNWSSIFNIWTSLAYRSSMPSLVWMHLKLWTNPSSFVYVKKYIFVIKYGPSGDNARGLWLSCPQTVRSGVNNFVFYTEKYEGHTRVYHNQCHAINQWSVSCFHVIAKPFLFWEGHLTQPIYLEKADNPLKDYLCGSSGIWSDAAFPLDRRSLKVRCL